MPNDEALTQSQWQWLYFQLLLDDGVQACPQCQTLGLGTFCHDCGTRVVPAPDECPQCHIVGTGPYCIHCGEEMRSDLGSAIRAGDWDWDAWLESIKPFLGGLTHQEQQILMREQIGYGVPVRHHNGLHS